MRAAAQGNARAQKNLGFCYNRGPLRQTFLSFIRSFVHSFLPSCLPFFLPSVLPYFLAWVATSTPSYTPVPLPGLLTLAPTFPPLFPSFALPELFLSFLPSFLLSCLPLPHSLHYLCRSFRPFIPCLCSFPAGCLSASHSASQDNPG